MLKSLKKFEKYIDNFIILNNILFLYFSIEFIVWKSFHLSIVRTIKISLMNKSELNRRKKNFLMNSRMNIKFE